MNEKRGNGYIEKSMSVNAKRAYDNEEMPLSKWTKKEILDFISCELSDDKFDKSNISKLTAKELKDNFLTCSSWHHTGSFYAATNFYEIDVNYVNEINAEMINNIISRRAPRQKKTDEEKATIKKNKSNLETAQDIYSQLDLIFVSGILNYKTIGGLVKAFLNNKIELESEYKNAIDKLYNDDFSKVKQWKLLPENHRRHLDVELYYSNKNEYVKRNYSSTLQANNKFIQNIKNSL